MYTDEAGTHTDWVAPDQTKLNSYATAVIYARKSGQPLYGKDGITRGLGFFFPATKTKSSTQTVRTPKPTARSSFTSDEVGTVAKQSTPENSARKFVIPTQTTAGAELQKLCSLLGNLKIKCHRKVKLEKQLEKYIAPSQLKNSMANKVIFIYISVATNPCSFPPPHTPVIMQIVKAEYVCQ